jgi:hypothetical protein
MLSAPRFSAYGIDVLDQHGGPWLFARTARGSRKKHSCTECPGADIVANDFYALLEKVLPERLQGSFPDGKGDMMESRPVAYQILRNGTHAWRGLACLKCRCGLG